MGNVRNRPERLGEATVATMESQSIESVYMRVCAEIEAAIKEGEIDRAHSMALRAADGKPKVLPKLQVEGKSE